MGMYAVYGRAVRHAEWSLRGAFAWQDEAERAAAALVAPPAGAARVGEGGAWIEAVVVEVPSRAEAAEHLPIEWIEPVVARFGHREAAEAASALETDGPGRGGS